MLHLEIFLDVSHFLISKISYFKYSVFVVNAVLVIVQLFKWTDGKPGGSPLLLPHVQISHRFWRPILPVSTGHPVGFFPHLGFVLEPWAWNFVISVSGWFSLCIFIVKSFVLQIICLLCFRYHYFPNRRGVPPTRRPAAQQFGGGGSGGRHNWGQGYQLGTEWEERRATATRNKQACSSCSRLKCLFSHILSCLTEIFFESPIKMCNFRSCKGKIFEKTHFIWSKTALGLRIWL